MSADPRSVATASIGLLTTKDEAPLTSTPSETAPTNRMETR
jgi:hypothetical protein